MAEESLEERGRRVLFRLQSWRTGARDVGCAVLDDVVVVASDSDKQPANREVG